MILWLLSILAISTPIYGADTRCTNLRGTCQTHSIPCPGGYRTGLCDGPTNRRCCLPSGDSACTNLRGVCQADRIACPGGYRTGLCAGAANRRCCLPGPTNSGGTNTCHGNIDRLSPTGKRSTGVSGSQATVRAHLSALNSMRSCYERVARDNCIEASVIAALASRESDGGGSLTAAGYGDGGRAWGILQCDLTHSGLPCRDCGARTCCHIQMMVSRLLIPYIRQVSAKHPTWTTEQKLQGGIAAYNFGVSNVQSWNGLDIGSTGNDYSNDVIARAKYLKSLGWP